MVLFWNARRDNVSLKFDEIKRNHNKKTEKVEKHKHTQYVHRHGVRFQFYYYYCLITCKDPLAMNATHELSDAICFQFVRCC